MEPATYEKQIEMIIEDGFTIEDKESCIEFLRRVSYYRISAFFPAFYKNKINFRRISFSKVQCVYRFDSLMRALLLQVIEQIEVYLRTQLAYYVAHKYGAFEYLKASMYSERHDMNKFSIKLKQCVEENKKTLLIKYCPKRYIGYYRNYEEFQKESEIYCKKYNTTFPNRYREYPNRYLKVDDNLNAKYIRHCEKCNIKFPIWYIIEFFSMGMLSFFYSDLQSRDRKAIAKETFNFPSADCIVSWLRCLTDLRNRCAHHSRLYYWTFSSIPQMPKKCNYKGDRKLFTQIFILKYLYPDKNVWNNHIVIEIETLIDEFFPAISLSHIGFPKNWKHLLYIN